MPTINEIARIVGVSKSTVSKALSGSTEVSSATRERIQVAAEKTGYFPSAAARMLSSRQTGAIGVVLPSNFGSGPIATYWSKVLSGILSVTPALGVSVVVSSVSDSGGFSAAYQKMVLEKRVDGLIVTGDYISREESARLIVSNAPCVFVGDAPQSAHSRVVVDEYSTALKLARRFADIGSQHVLCLWGDAELPSVRARSDGFQTGADDARLNASSVNHHYGDPGIYDHVLDVIIHDSTIDALIAGAGDFILTALAVRQDVLAETGRTLRIGVFDDVGISQAPPFSGVISVAAIQPVFEVGVKAVELLMKQMQQPDVVHTSTLEMKLSGA